MTDNLLVSVQKLLDAGYTWNQLIPRLMNQPPNVVLYRKQECEHPGSDGDDPVRTDTFCGPTCKAYVGREGWYLVQVWPKP